jgi:hypothetical protein
MAAWKPMDWIAYGVFFLGVVLCTIRDAHLPMLDHLIPSSSVWAFTPLALMIIASVILLWRAIRPSGRRSPEILAPLDGYSVGFTHTVIGMIDPSDAPIQILVHAGDERWHPQGRPKIEGLAFSAQCQFGGADSRPGRMYRIVALSGAPPVPSPTYELPRRGRKSQIVRVVRTT